jgi:hypothetical protein
LFIIKFNTNIIDFSKKEGERSSRWIIDNIKAYAEGNISKKQIDLEEIIFD